MVLIVPIREYVLGTDVLVGQAVETLNGRFWFGISQAGFAAWSVAVWCGFLKRDPAVLPVPAKVVTVKRYRALGGWEGGGGNHSKRSGASTSGNPQGNWLLLIILFGMFRNQMALGE